MSAPLKVLIISLVWLVYTFALFRLNVTAESASVTEPETEAEAAVSAVNTFPIGFRWSVDTAFTTDRFEAFKRTQLGNMEPDAILEITGLYYEGEDKPTGAASMGFARAERVKALFAGDLPDDRIRTRARLEEEKEGMRTGYFESVEFNWIKPEETVEQTVEELKDRIIIRFPYGSATKEYDPEVDEYLKKLGERIKQTGENVSLTGHTDNTGSEEYNLELGLDRVKGIQNLLVANGVPKSQIQIDSKGESQPVDTNETEEGRHNNRRVEVRLNKQ
jgi:OmpA-OmpF porin, OOP family